MRSLTGDFGDFGDFKSEASAGVTIEKINEYMNMVISEGALS